MIDSFRFALFHSLCPEKVSTLTMCKKHLQLDLQGLIATRFLFGVPALAFAFLFHWLGPGSSARGDLLVAHFPCFANSAADVHARGRPYWRGR